MTYQEVWAQQTRFHCHLDEKPMMMRENAETCLTSPDQFALRRSIRTQLVIVDVKTTLK